MCDKVAFRCEKSARSALRKCRHNRRRNPARKECRIYWCSHCHAYHLTSNPMEPDLRIKPPRRREAREALREMDAAEG